jgi:hypothetical protein
MQQGETSLREVLEFLDMDVAVFAGPDSNVIDARHLFARGRRAILIDLMSQIHVKLDELRELPSDA